MNLFTKIRLWFSGTPYPSRSKYESLFTRQLDVLSGSDLYRPKLKAKDSSED